LENNKLATKKTATQLVESYRKAIDRTNEAYAILESVESELEATFGREAYMTVLPKNERTNRAREKVLEELKRSAWRRIISISQIEKMLSSKRAEQMRERLHNGDLPEITLDEVLSMLDSLMNNADDFVKEAAAEVFEVLRPASRSGWPSKYKTNQKYAKYELGQKVILANYIEFGYNGCFRVGWGYVDTKLMAIDRVFHALDGNLRGMEDANRSPLIDAIQTTKQSEGAGETEYFKFKLYKNGNMHLEFKRMDLVKKLNVINADSGILTE
jgi:hypothetical protein